MIRFTNRNIVLVAGAMLFATSVFGKEFNIPSGSLNAALNAYGKHTGIQLIYSGDAVSGVRTKGVKGDFSAADALSRLLDGTGLTSRHESGGIVVSRDASAELRDGAEPPHVAAASAPIVPGAALETVTVTSSKVGGDVQNIPISITAMSQEQLTTTQTTGGPDLVKEVPNLTFSKTNFTGYNIQIRGIGTQAISVTTDPAVAVAFNDMPFIRNHFFEQEFYDVGQLEVLRGPQGTLYGRNATAGVVNIVSAKPTDQFEGMISADFGNFQNRRFEGMVNVPLIDDRLDFRAAAEWTKRKGYSFNDLTDQAIDGRDLWSGRATIGFKPSDKFKAYLVWEHFSEDDDRMRSSKQLCKTAPIPDNVLGVPVPAGGNNNVSASDLGGYFTQGCLPVSLYSPDAFEVPNGYGLPFVAAGEYGGELSSVDPYSSTTQSRNLRVIESTLNPAYKAKNDVVELNADYNLTPALTFTSQTGYNQDFLYSTEDYNRFNTAPGIFPDTAGAPFPIGLSNISPGGIFCDPQLSCSNRLVAQDLSDEHAWQISQEFRLASNFSGPLNFSVGGNYMHYETEENYYVFINLLTAFTYDTADIPALPGGSGLWIPGVSDGHECLSGIKVPSGGGLFQFPNPQFSGGAPGDSSCSYIDPNPIGSLNNEGHNYFLSQNPYILSSYAGFGEVYYQAFQDLKLTGGLRWTQDRKHFVDIPSEVVTNGYGYPITDVVDQQWDQLTGRAAANWTPKLDFTDQTLIYGSYAHGYKAGGANPPGARLDGFEKGTIADPVHPLTFKPEFVDAFELGTKNTGLDGTLTVNGDIFFYNYKNYQISEIVDRTSINLNFNATVKGAELETSWEPTPGLKFTFTGGYEDTRIDNGQSAVDLIDRTAGMAGWMVVKPFITQTSNCILPDYVVAASLQDGIINPDAGSPGAIIQACGAAYNEQLDPVTDLAYTQNPSVRCSDPFHFGSACTQFSSITGYAGFDPTQPAINNGEGFAKDLSGKQLPNAPHFTTSFTAEYSLPITDAWLATLHSDFYWQASSFARVFNDKPYDEIHGYSNVNLALIFTNENGWQAMGYLKNVFNTTAITGDFLNSDDSGLTTNVFLTDPRLYGIRVTKNF